MAGIEEAFEKFVKKISDTEEESENKNLKFGRDVYAPEEGLFFKPVQKNQSSFAERLRSDPRLSPPLPNMRERDLTPEERIRLGDNQYFMSQDRPEYASPVVQGQGFNKRDVKDFAREYIQTQTPLGGGIGYQGPEYGVMAIKPFVGPDRSALLQAYYNTDNEGSRIQAMLSPKEQQIGYTGNTGTTFSAGRNTFQGSPYYTLNLSKSFADGGVASMFRERPEYSLGGPTKAIRKISPETPMEEPFPSGLAIKSIRPTQQAIDDFVNQPIPMGQMIPVNEFLPGEDYQTYVRRKRAETGPALFAGEPVTMPVLPSTPTPQVDVSANPVARALEMAGFTREEIMRILGQQGFADGGRAGYAEGSKPTREDSPILQINPMERDIQFSQDPTMDQIPNVGIAAIGLTKKAKDYNRYLKAFESNDPKVFKKWFDSQTKEFSKTKKLAEDAEMFEIIPEVARGASKTEKQIANNQLRESMGRYYAQELGPYYSQEVGILDNLTFKAYGGRVSMSDGGLTNTIPPAKGPDSQGVESLFRRRYN